MLYDTHCHPYLAHKKTQEAILENFFENGGIYLNSISVDIESSETCLKLSQKYDGVFAVIGIHPTYTYDYKDSLEGTLEKLKKLISDHKEQVVAIGEIGLDYYWEASLAERHQTTREDIGNVQKQFFRAQLQLAKDLNLPIVIHNREASEDIFALLVEENIQDFVFHCYSENLDFARRLIDFAPDCKLGFGGIVTFKNSETIKEVVQNIPLKNIILETDSPYLTPTPLRGKEENEPLFTQYVLKEIISLRKESAEEITLQIFQNSTDVFRI